MTFSRVACLAMGALLLAAVGSFAMPAAYLPFLLPGTLIVLVLAAAAWKVWERPALGVAAAVVLIAAPWGTGEEGQGTNVTLADLAAAGVAALVALRVMAVGDQGRLRSWVLLPLLGVVVAGSIATLGAKEPATSLAGLVRYVEFFAVVPIATYLTIRNRKDLALILGAVVALGVLEGALGAYQFLTGTGAEYGGSSNRAVGTFGAYGIMGLAQVVTAAIVVATAAFAVLRDRRRTWALLLLAALVPPLAFSFSRGSWIAAAAGVMVILALTSRKALVLVVVAGGVALLGVGTAFSGDDSGVLTSRLTSIYSATSSPDQSVKDRYALWEAARGMWKDRPITGVGLKNFSHLRDSYAPLSFSGGSDIADQSSGYRRVELLSPHSLYWLILAEQGLVGALAFGSLLLSLGVAAVRRSLTTEGSPVERVFGLSCVGFLAAYSVSGLYSDVGGVTYLLYSVFFGGLAWFTSGVGLEEER